MTTRSVVKTVVLPTGIIAVAATGISIAVSMATSGKYSAWLWTVVAGLTLVSFLGSLWLYRRQNALSENDSRTVCNVGGNIDIRADRGSAAALQMGNVSIASERSVDPPVPGDQSN